MREETSEATVGAGAFEGPSGAGAPPATHPTGSHPLRISWLALACFLLFSLLTAGAYFGVRHLIANQENQILHERGRELALFLDQSLSTIAAELPPVGTIESASHPSPSLFEKITAPLTKGGKSSVAVAQLSGGSLDLLAQAGPTLAASSLEGTTRIVAQNARAAKGLVFGIAKTTTGRQLVFAERVGNVIVMDISPLAETKKPAPPGNSPFSDVNLALYASPAASPKTLLLVSGQFPSGAVASTFIHVGSSRWLVLVNARKPLIGSVAEAVPWITLLIGLLGSLLIATIVETLVRRQHYALALVEERTAVLNESLREQNQLQAAETRAREEAETANRSKNEFLSRMSHELRTPLNAVIGFAQLLSRQDLNEDQRDSVHHIMKGGQYLLELINEVLDISRVETGDLALSPEPVLVSDLLTEVTSLIRPLADQKSIYFIRSQDSHCDKFVFADRHRLEQVVLNLLSNAVKYNHTGGSVTIACEPVNSTRIRIKIEDTGSGIPQELTSRLFVPFDRLGAERSGTEGTGIGLSLSRKLTEAMGGSLGFESTVGIGSTFWIDLAVVEGPIERYERLHQGGKSASEDLPPLTPGGLKVLYIEDNLANLSLVQKIMTERKGIEIMSSMQGRLGIELAQKHLPFLILLDLHLPDMTGEEVLHRLRENPLTASISVVIVSADATYGQVQRLLSAGAVAYLTKPINVDKLLSVIDEHVPTRSTQ